MMRAVLVGLAAVFCASLMFVAPPAALSAPPTSHINSSWSKTICCVKEKNAFWSTDRQCRLAQGATAKEKACNDADAKIKACCKKEAKLWWSTRLECRRSGIVVAEGLCPKKG